MNLMTSLRTLPLALLLAAPSLASAISLGDGALFLGGYGSWSYQVTNEDRFLMGDPDGDWDTARFDFAAIARPTDAIRINALLSFRGKEAEAEWAYVDYAFSDKLHLRMGKIKQPLGNYMETAEVGVLRPFQDLATAVYGPANLGASAYQGIGFTGSFVFDSGYTLDYDLWGGSIFLDAYEPFDAYNGELAFPAGAGFAPGTEEIRVENIVGGRLSLTTPSALTFRLSSYGGKSETDEGVVDTIFVAGLSAWYRNEKLWLSAEGFYGIEGEEEKVTAAYVEAAWHFTPEIQAAAKFEYSRTDVDGLLSRYDAVEKHDEISLGLNYWFTPTFVVRASADYVFGSRFVEAEDWEEWSSTGAANEVPPLPADQLLRFTFGTAFSF